MSKRSRLLLVILALSLPVVLTISDLYAKGSSNSSEADSKLAALLDEKLEYYRHQYPEISFLILKGGDELVADMMALDKSLGNEPASLDYEHPPELRKELMTASANRILHMLQFKMPSASLFKTDSPHGRKNICVLTIHPQAVAADSIHATINLLDLPPQLVQKIPKDLLLSADDYLAFVIDHEVYHCLQSMYSGPQKRSFKEYWGVYNHFLNEQGADAYGMGMHIKNYGKVTDFARNLQRIRGMALYSGDPDHLTCKSLQQVLKIPAMNFKKMTANEVFEMAIRIKGHLTSGYDAYLVYLASAVQAMKELGVEGLISDDLHNIANDHNADPTEVKQLVTNSRRCFSELCMPASQP